MIFTKRQIKRNLDWKESKSLKLNTKTGQFSISPNMIELFKVGVALAYDEATNKTYLYATNEGYSISNLGKLSSKNFLADFNKFLNPAEKGNLFYDILDAITIESNGSNINLYELCFDSFIPEKVKENNNTLIINEQLTSI